MFVLALGDIAINWSWSVIRCDHLSRRAIQIPHPHRRIIITIWTPKMKLVVKSCWIRWHKSDLRGLLSINLCSFSEVYVSMIWQGVLPEVFDLMRKDSTAFSSKPPSNDFFLIQKLFSTWKFSSSWNCSYWCSQIFFFFSYASVPLILTWSHVYNRLADSQMDCKHCWLSTLLTIVFTGI